MNKKIIASLLLAAMTVSTYAQSGTNSAYSQYGIGVLADHSLSANRGMNGVGLAMRQGNRANVLNPASYSAVDSITMIFDMGLAGQITNIKEGKNSVNANNASFEYAVGSFRLLKNVGFTFGIIPFSNVGYNYAHEQYLDETNGTVTTTMKGSGGLRQVFIGAGWRFLKPLSVGFNLSYLWGSIDRTVTSSSTVDMYNLQKTYSASVRNYKLDFGLQWQQRLSKTDDVTLGVTIGLGHKLGADPTLVVANTSTSQSTTYTIKNGLKLPMTYAAGVAWQHRHSLLIEADVKMQKWGSTEFPVYENNDYQLKSGILKDRYEVRAGAEWTPNRMSRNLLNRVNYRIGAGYATPYYKINGQNGPKELSVSAGFGFPIQNGWNGRSMLSITGQWVQTSATGLLKENAFRLTIGMTFNERWFQKWKVQ